MERRTDRATVKQADSPGWRVWIQPYREEWYEGLDESMEEGFWSVPRKAQKGDLVICYVSYRWSCFAHIAEIASQPVYRRAEFRAGLAYMAHLRPVCRLDDPVRFRELRTHPVLKKANFVRAGVVMGFDATPFWPHLRRLIVQKNRTVGTPLATYESGHAQPSPRRHKRVVGA